MKRTTHIGLTLGLSTLLALILCLSISSCTASSYVRSELYMNGIPFAGYAICELPQECHETAEVFCSPKGVTVIKFYEDIERFPYYDREFEEWQHFVKKSYSMRFVCCGNN